MARRVKELAVQELSERFAQIQQCGCIVMGFAGMRAQDSAGVRRLLSDEGSRMTVVKNAVFALALERLGVRELEGVIDGPTAIITGEDAVSAAKAAREAAVTCKGLRILGGYVEGRVLNSGEVEKLASLPGRDVLLSQVLGCVCTPAQRFAGCVAAVFYRLVSVLDQFRRKKQQEEAGSEA